MTGLESSRDLPLALLARYLFFLARRPISSSNTHFLARRLAGLRSLAPLIVGDADDLGPVADKLSRLTPGNFRRLGPEIQRALAFWLPPELPTGYIASRIPPPADFLAGVRRVLMILGPAIGIGDEIICFSVPRWLRGASPEVEVSMMSAYPDLWDGVAGITGHSCYRSHAELVAAIRGKPPGGAFDLVWMIDFEKPALLNAMSTEPAVARYVEISLGTRAAWALDKASGWLHEHQPPERRYTNYYSVLRHLTGWLTGTPAPASAGSVGPCASSSSGTEDLTIFVSPFTSKYEPQPLGWSQLLAAAIPDRPGVPIRFVFDPGPNLTTERFAIELMRSTRGLGRPEARFELAGSPGARTLSLIDLFAQLERSDVAICADSFAAHAAPVRGCTTLVVAGKGLENWRVPREQAYYFDGAVPIPRLAAAMGLVIGPLAKAEEPPGAVVTGAAAHRLLGASEEFAQASAEDGEDEVVNALLGPYDGLYRAFRAFIGGLPPGSPALCSNRSAWAA